MPTVHIFGVEIEKKKLLIGGVVIAAAVAVVVWLRSRAASAAASADQSAIAPTDQGSGGGAMTIPAATADQAAAYQQQLENDQLAAAGLAAQYQGSLAQQQFAAQQLLNNANPLQQAEQSNAAFFASNPLSSAQATGVVQQKWKQFLLNGQTIWEDVSGKNRAPITEQLAEQEGAQPKGEGPYYQSKGGGVFAPILHAASNVVNGVVKGIAQEGQQAAGAYFAQQGIPYTAPSTSGTTIPQQTVPNYTPPFVAYPGAPGVGPYAPPSPAPTAQIARAPIQRAQVHSHSYQEIV